MLFLKFFKWLYNPNEPDPKERETPACMKGIKQLPRKEISSYKPDDMWTNRRTCHIFKILSESYATDVIMQWHLTLLADHQSSFEKNF